MRAVQRGQAVVRLLLRSNPSLALHTAAALLLPSLLVLCAYAAAPKPAPSPSPRTLNRVRDLIDLRNALEAYRTDHGRYPESPGPGAWAAIHNASGLPTPSWIPDLAPRYIASLPRDPRSNLSEAGQYVYASNGTNFKLLALYPEQDCEVIAKLRPDLLDPIRGGDPYSCHAYGFWSPGGAKW